jgi:glycine hydroxymethyltransferase
MQPFDTTLDLLIEQETNRQRDSVSLIASENDAFDQVLTALSSSLTNKYAEGYPGKRYYAGCEIVDQIETLAQERCKKLFSADHANVQPHSGSQANMAAYAALLKPGDTLLGLSLSSGGHLTHGHSVNFSGQLYNHVAYTLNAETELIDYELLAQLANQHRPKLIIAGASSYSRTIDFEKFHEIAKSIGAFLLVDCAHTAGLITTGTYPNPAPFADIITGTTHKTLRGPRGGFILCRQELQERIDKAVFPGIQGGPFMNVIAAKAIAFYEAAQPQYRSYIEQALSNAQTMVKTLKSLGYRIVSGGTDTHLCVVDLRNKGITGRAAENALETAGINVSRSTIPFDTEKPLITSGIRLGTLAITTRGYKEEDVITLMQHLDEVVQNPHNHMRAQAIKAEIVLLNQDLKKPAW